MLYLVEIGHIYPKMQLKWVRNFVGKMFDRDPKLYQSYSERERSGIFTQNCHPNR